MSIYEILPALDLTQSVHAKISIGMHRVVKFKISRIPLIWLETRLGWRTDRKFLRNPNLNEITDYAPSSFKSPSKTNYSRCYGHEVTHVVTEKYQPIRKHNFYRKCCVTKINRVVSRFVFSPFKKGAWLFVVVIYSERLYTQDGSNRSTVKKGV